MALSVLIVLCLQLGTSATAAQVLDLARTKTSDPRAAGDSGAGTAPSCGTTRYKKPNGHFWRCTFGDSFTGTSLDPSHWSIQTTKGSGYFNGPECYTDSPGNVSVSDGSLKLTARDEGFLFDCVDLPASPTQYSGGMVTTINKFSQTYGRFEIRARFPRTTTQGVTSSLWMWPETQVGTWPTSGEIDIAEFFSRASDRVIPYVHYVPETADPDVTNTNCLVAHPHHFHRYLLVWTRHRLTMKYDGNLCLTDRWLSGPLTERPAPFNTPFFFALTQALGTYQNAFEPGTTPLPATMTVAYVRAWK